MTLSSAVLALLLVPQSAPGVDDQKVTAAIERGVAWLRKAPSPGEDNQKKAPIRNADDLLLLTFLHAGVPQDDPRVRELLAAGLAAPLDRTYPVALRAMALEELDRVRYQSHIARCAQYLLDNQLASGQWGYGEPSVTADAMSVESVPASPEPAPAVGKDGRRTKPKVVRKLTLKQTRVPSGTGDFSNTQYAALGLRAAVDAGILLPKDGITRAILAINAAQQAGPPPQDGAAPSLPAGRKARGWCYDNPCKCPLHRPYGTMTAGMVSSLAIFDYILGRDSRRNTAILDGVAWLQVHYTVETVPGPIEWDKITKPTYLPYYLYGLERAGILTGNEKFGTRPWYADGVRVLLESQKPDGSWGLDDWGTPTWDTCLALLFLRRSTRPLVPSTDRVIRSDDDR